MASEMNYLLGWFPHQGLLENLFGSKHITWKSCMWFRSRRLHAINQRIRQIANQIIKGNKIPSSRHDKMKKKKKTAMTSSAFGQRLLNVPFFSVSTVHILLLISFLHQRWKPTGSFFSFVMRNPKRVTIVIPRLSTKFWEEARRRVEKKNRFSKKKKKKNTST